MEKVQVESKTLDFIGLKIPKDYDTGRRKSSEMYFNE